MDISFFVRQSSNELSRFDDGKIALAFEDQPGLTFAQVRDRSWRIAHGLIERGVRPGDRVSVALYNSVDYWSLYFAITRIGAIIVRVNFRLRGDELEFILQDSGSTVLIAEPEILAEVEQRRDRLPVTAFFSCGAEPEPDEGDWFQSVESLVSARSAEPDVPRAAPDHPAMIMYTSGTTGRPKGVIWSHGNTMWWAAMQQVEWGFTEQSVTMATGPMYHIGALENYVLPTLSAGGTVVVFGSTGFRLDRAVDVAARTGVTDILLFPAMLQELARLEPVELARLSALRRIFTGGDNVPESVVDRLLDVLPHVELTQVYGLTEGTPIAASSPPGLTRERADLIGSPFPFTELSIRDNQGKELPPGTVGEIWTKSPAGSNGYWNRPGDNAKTFIDGWCRTGDAGKIEAGYLRFAGRQKDIIRSGGENISPAEVENVLKQHPAIFDVAVIGVPHPTLVETVCAVVVRHPDTELEAAEVVRFCSSRLAGYKKPRAVMFTDELPRTPSLKVQKFILRDEFATSGVTVS